MKKVIKVDPMGKPRMVASDRWRKRPCVLRYWEFKAELLRLMAKSGIKASEECLSISFYMAMPKSWAKKKKAKMLGQPHKQKPDIDNLVKGFLDAVLEEDCTVWDISAKKFWAEEGRIEIYE